MYQRMLVTGGHGFLGSHFMEKTSTEPTIAHSIFTPTHAEYDLRIQTEVERLFRDTQPDIVLHLAARVGGIGENRECPGQLFYDNALMGIMLMEAARVNDVKKYINVGTVCSYPSNTKVPFKEDALWDGYPEMTNAPYGIAKKMLLTQAIAYKQEYGFHSNYLLLTNLYGPRDNMDLRTSHVVSALIRKFSTAVAEGKKKVVLWGDGTPTRELLYVTDAADAIIAAVNTDVPLVPINIGSGNEVPIADLAEMIASQCGYHGDVVWDVSYPNGQMRRRVDTSIAKDLLQFEAKTPLQEGLHNTIQWYMAHQQERQAVS